MRAGLYGDAATKGHAARRDAVQAEISHIAATNDATCERRSRRKAKEAGSLGGCWLADQSTSVRPLRFYLFILFLFPFLFHSYALVFPIK